MKIKENEYSKYRFKTEKEFVKEFGKSWRTRVELGFVENMNPFLGKFLSDFKVEENKDGMLRVCTEAHLLPWNVSYQMLTRQDFSLIEDYRDYSTVL